MASITIRNGSREDCQAVTLIWDIAQTARQQIPPPATPNPETLEIVRKRVDNESPWMFIAEDHGQAIGIAFALQARKQDETKAIIPGLLHISMVGVLPEYWGRGIASALIAEILKRARGIYSHAQLWTQLTNVRAHDLYTRLGFTATEERNTDDKGEEIQKYVIPLE